MNGMCWNINDHETEDTHGFYYSSYFGMLWLFDTLTSLNVTTQQFLCLCVLQLSQLTNKKKLKKE